MTSTDSWVPAAKRGLTRGWLVDIIIIIIRNEYDYGGVMSDDC